MTPSKQMALLIEQLRQDTAASKITALRKGVPADLGLVNQFQLHDFLPNKWFDWENRANAQIMILGQDWGPYSVLKSRYIDDYEAKALAPGFDYNAFMFSGFSSRTEKFILKAVQETYANAFGQFEPKIWDDIIFTMAVLFTRQGKHFRGNHNFDPKKSALISYPYVARQLEIVKPKIIITMGGMPFEVVNKYYNLGYKGRTITSIIEEIGDGVIRADNTIIIPNFHPASYTDPNLQLKIWGKIWNYYKP